MPVRTVGLIDGLLRIKAAASDVERGVLQAKEAIASREEDRIQYCYESEKMEPAIVKKAKQIDTIEKFTEARNSFKNSTASGLAFSKVTPSSAAVQ